MSEPNILSIPASTFSFFVAPCLDSFDLLSLRAASKDCHSFLHHDEEDKIWKEALIRDFSFEDVKSDSNENKLDITLTDQYLQTLRISEDHKRAYYVTNNNSNNKQSLSVFGYSASDGIITATSFFQSWKLWRKASCRYYHEWTEKNPTIHARQSKNINAPCTS